MNINQILRFSILDLRASKDLKDPNKPGVLYFSTTETFSEHKGLESLKVLVGPGKENLLPGLSLNNRQ